MESLSLDHQGSPSDIFIFLFTDEKTEAHKGAVVTQTHSYKGEEPGEESILFTWVPMATHSSTLAWKIPWTEEPGRLQSMGSLRVRHD